MLSIKIVYVTEMSSKIASTLSQKWLTIFYQKPHVVQISPASGANTYQKLYGEISDFQCQGQ